jgi:integrase/recombinase XerD
MSKTLALAPIRIEEWPALDAANWHAALARGSVFDAGGALASRTERDLKQFRYSFGVWLAFLKLRPHGPVIESGLDYLDEADLRPFLQLLESRLASYSVLAILRGLIAAARAMAPARSYPKLEQIGRYTKRTAEPSRDKRSRLRTPGQLRALGFQLMAQPQLGTARIRYFNRYLDGLAIAMLAAAPLRISNFAALQLGQGIQRKGDVYWISVEKTKNGRPIEFALPPELTHSIEHYLAEPRPGLLAQGEESSAAPQTAFWVSSWGTPLTSQLLAKRISRRTREAFGVGMSPHLFRDAVATTIAIEDPEHVGMILPILGHSSLKVSEKHYNQARTLESSRKYLSILESLRATKGA